MLALLTAPSQGPADGDEGSRFARASWTASRHTGHGGSASSSAGAGTLGCRPTPFGVYVHVPFCAARCGYCDFNTYTPSELAGSGASPDGWLEAVRQELELARSVVGDRPADTVFVGGGTPSLLGADRLAAVLDAVRTTFGLAPGAEVTTETNPESTSPEFFAALAEAGFTRVSLGMQSAAPHVLRVLDRRHTPGRAVAAAREARAAGLQHVNLDLIYAHARGDRRRPARVAGRGARRGGRPRLGVRADRRGRHGAGPAGRARRAAGAGRRRGRGALRADRRPADGRAGCPGTRSRTGRRRRTRGAGTTWGTGSTATGGALGPGAHSHLAGARWWNVKHPARYAALLAAGSSAGGRPGGADRRRARTERVMLRLRLATGLTWRCSTTPAGPRRRGPRTTGSSIPRPWPAPDPVHATAAPSSPAAAGCWPTRWCTPCSPRPRPGPRPAPPRLPPRLRASRYVHRRGRTFARRESALRRESASAARRNRGTRCRRCELRSRTCRLAGTVRDGA